jgi:hypothetical protein
MKQILPNIEQISSLLNLFKKGFSKPQFRHFCKYEEGIITLPVKSISSISAADPRQMDHSSLNRFLTDSDWDEKQIESRYYSKVSNVFQRDNVSLILDDSISEKSGKKIEQTQYHKDHTGKGYVFGHQIVTALLKSKEKVFPLFPRIYSKKTESKIEIAKDIIDFAGRRFHPREAIMDSWYMCTDIIKKCLNYNMRVIGCIKSNRNISLKPGEKVKLSKYYGGLKKRDFQIAIIDDNTYMYHEKIVRLKHIGPVKLLITKEWNQKDKKWSRPFYLISTDTSMSATKIIRSYSGRWEIETFHRDIKQNLGLEACQVRGILGITRHLMLVTLAYALLKFWMYFEKIDLSIGEAIRRIQGITFDDLIITIVNEPSQVERWKLAEPYLSRTARV